MTGNNDEKLPFLKKNKEALAAFERAYGQVHKAFSARSASTCISLLRRHGYRCARCGANDITYLVLKFYNYRADARCWTCQRTEETACDTCGEQHDRDYKCHEFSSCCGAAVNEHGRCTSCQDHG